MIFRRTLLLGCHIFIAVYYLFEFFQASAKSIYLFSNDLKRAKV